MKRLIRIIFLLVLIQHIITSTLCTEDGNGCYAIDIPPAKFCGRFGDYCKIVPYCEKASKEEKECKLYPVVVGAHIQGCFPNDNGGCVMRPLCTTINKPTTDEECRKHPVSFNKVIDHICVAKSDKTGCEEKLLCESVSTLNEGEICGNFPVLNIDNVCIYNEWGGTLCIEKEYCSNTRGYGYLNDQQCSTYPISEKDNKDDYLCVPKYEGSCEERLDCEKVTKLEKGEKCSDFPTAMMRDTICVENTDETSEKKCKTEPICSKRTGDDASKESCPNYPVRYVKRYDHHCEMGKGACVEIENKCRDVTFKTKDCFKYKVSDENKENYGCVNIPGAKGCKEMKKCEMVEQLEENDNCYNYAPNALGSLCVNNTEKTEGSKEICKNIKTCNYASERDGKPLSADVCSEYQISLENINTHICLFNKETDKCYEEILCEKVKLDPKGNKNCSYYPVKKENEQTHICVSNEKKRKYL